MTQRHPHALRLLLPAALLACALLPLTSATALASGPGYVRLAHLSPDTPQVDVWLTSFKGSSFSKVFPGVGYGVLSDYQRLTPGTYTVAMRPPGSSGTVAPLLRTTLTVQSGKAYTVAGVGKYAQVSLRVLNDNLDRPGAGKARMRVVHASSVAPVIDVTTSTGESIASGVHFPATTSYTEVSAQAWTLKVQPRQAGVASAQKTLQVREGAIYTALVLDRGNSGVQLVVRSDAAAAATTPVGSVNTGQRAASVSSGFATPWALLAWLGLALILTAFARRRRGQA